MSTSFWLDRSPKKAKTSCDVVIVGAGISGVSTAFWLNKEDPSLNITLVEKSRLGYGATGRNAGFITCGSVEHFNRMVTKHGKEEALEIWKFSETNLKLLKEHIIQDQADAIQFLHNGTFSLAATDAEMAELKKAGEMMAKDNIQVEMLDSAGVEKRLGATGFVGGAKYLDDANVNPYLMLQHMMSKVKANFMEGTEVFGVEQTPEGNRIVRTDNGDIECTMVIYALNGYLASLHPYFADKVYPTRGQILVTEPVAPFMEGPCYANFYLDYFRQLKGGELIIGGFRQIEKDTEVGYSDHTTNVIQTALHNFVMQHLPKFKDCKITHRWAGIMGFSRDGQPMVGSLPDDPQTFFIGGYTGHGIGLAFHTAKCLADVIFGRDVPKFLSGRRFQ